MVKFPFQSPTRKSAAWIFSRINSECFLFPRLSRRWVKVQRLVNGDRVSNTCGVRTSSNARCFWPLISNELATRNTYGVDTRRHHGRADNSSVFTVLLTGAPLLPVAGPVMSSLHSMALTSLCLSPGEDFIKQECYA